MGGVVGSFDLAGAALGPFWPVLWLGQWTHAGKGCSMGLGRYVLEPLGAEGVVSGPGGKRRLRTPASGQTWDTGPFRIRARSAGDCGAVDVPVQVRPAHPYTRRRWVPCP